MNIRNVYQSLAIVFRSTRIESKEVRWTFSRNCHFINKNLPQNGQTSGQLSYVQRMKLLQNLREKTGITEEAVKNGKYLIYYKGDPLLTEDFSIAWLNYSDLQVDPKLFLENAMLLGMAENGQFQFSLQIASFGPETKKSVLDKSQGSFTDFRLSLMVRK